MEMKLSSIFHSRTQLNMMEQTVCLVSIKLHFVTIFNEFCDANISVYDSFRFGTKKNIPMSFVLPPRKFDFSVECDIYPEVSPDFSEKMLLFTNLLPNLVYNLSWFSQAILRSAIILDFKNTSHFSI